MYKDKDKQREANRQAQARFKAKGITKSITIEGITCAPQVIPEGINQDLSIGVKPERTERGNIRVSKLGDADYVPQCETTRAFIDNRPKRPETGKRGLDIKCFADLPPDVQRTIRRISESNEEFQRRVGIAIHYQHVFPSRYYQ